MLQKIGLLLPKSVLYPSINFDIVDGVRLGLKEQGIEDFELKMDSVGLGADDKVIYSCCEKMLFDNVTIVVAYINPTSAEKLQTLFLNAESLLIVIHAGMHFPRTLDKQGNIFYVSLQGTLGCRINAIQAISDGWRKFAYTGSFYDAGYRSGVGFYGGILQNEGNFTVHQVTKLSRKEFTLEPVKENLAQNADTAVIASFCGDMLQDFCTETANDAFYAGKKIYGSSFFGDEEWLAKSPYPGCDITTCVPWASSLINEENEKFVAAFARKNKITNYFSYLAYTASYLIAHVAGFSDVKTAINEIEACRFKSPAGEVTVDPDTHRCYSDMYMAKVVRNADTGNCTLQIIHKADNTAAERAALQKEIRAFDGRATSWFNAYGCLEG